MRILKLSAPLLALIFGITAEALSFLVTRLFGIIGYLHFSKLQDFWYLFYMCFYRPAALFAEGLAEYFSMSHDVGMRLLIFFGVVQWWLIFLVTIVVVRCFRHRYDRAVS